MIAYSCAWCNLSREGKRVRFAPTNLYSTQNGTTYSIKSYYSSNGLPYKHRNLYSSLAARTDDSAC